MTTQPHAQPLAAWSRARQDPQLRELPYKVETNEHGQLVFSPHEVQPGVQQVRVAELLLERQLRPGRRAVEFVVQTSAGTKVPDSVWISDERWAMIPKNAEDSPVAPELVVEVLSRSNTAAEVQQKQHLYPAGAHEAWTCDPNRRMHLFSAGGEIERSEQVPSFPKRLT